MEEYQQQENYDQTSSLASLLLYLWLFNLNLLCPKYFHVCEMYNRLWDLEDSVVNDSVNNTLAVPVLTNFQGLSRYNALKSPPIDRSYL